MNDAEEYLIDNVVTDKQSYYYGKAVGNAICVAEGIVLIGVGLKVIYGGITLTAGGTLLTMTGAGAGLGDLAIAICVAEVAVGSGITVAGGRMMYSSANKFKENISKAKKVKVEVDDINLKEDIKKLDDGISEAENIITDGSHIQNGKLKPDSIYKIGEHDYVYKTNQDGLIINAKTDKLELNTRVRTSYFI